jgi:hypothetical protein
MPLKVANVIVLIKNIVEAFVHCSDSFVQSREPVDGVHAGHAALLRRPCRVALTASPCSSVTT